MRDQRESESVDPKYGVEERIINWVLTSREHGFVDGFNARDVMNALGTHKTTTCRMLIEMLSNETLCRNRVSGKWHYRILSQHDPEDYIETRRAEVQVNKRIATHQCREARAWKRLARVEELAKTHKLFVSCKCGRRMGFKISIEEIDDSSERCDEGNGSLV